MREFGEADKQKKRGRISIGENPGNLPEETLERLEELVKASLKDGYLPCATALRIAKDADVPRISVGGITDKLGIRVSNCQIGCFKVDKIINDNPPNMVVNDSIIEAIENLEKNNALSCVNVFELAAKQKVAPMTIANAVNVRKWKIRQCQLGCF